MWSSPGKKLQSPSMKPVRRLVISMLALGWIVPSSPRIAHAQEPSVNELLVLDNVTVVDVRTGKLEPDQTVILERHRIFSIRPSKAAKYPRNADSVNGKGLYLIPGLWDMHVHLVFGDWFPDPKDISLPLFIANGVTGVRDMGSELHVVQDWRNQIAAGRLIGPRILTSGPMLDGPRPRFPSSVAIASPEDARHTVDDLKARGADIIKLQSLNPREAVLAIAEEAKKQGIAFEGHGPDAQRASKMAEARMKRSEHLIGMFEGSSPAGVHIFPGLSLHEELQRFVAAGFTPLEALQTATLNPARFFGMETQLGTVEEGKLADLVVLSGNPLEDISNTQKIAGVFVNGRYFSHPQIENMLRGVEAAARRRP